VSQRTIESLAHSLIQDLLEEDAIRSASCDDPHLSDTDLAHQAQPASRTHILEELHSQPPPQPVLGLTNSHPVYLVTWTGPSPGQPTAVAIVAS
jgi:hypothetical protein